MSRLPGWRVSALDVALALGVLLVGLLEFTGAIPGSTLPGRPAVTLVFIVATAMPLVLRRVYPMTTFVGVVLVTTVWQYTQYTVTEQQTFEAFLALLVAVFGAGAYTSGRTAAAALATVGVGVVLGAVDLLAGAPLGMAVPPLLMIVGIFLLGRLVAGYRTRARDAVERVGRAEREAEEARRATVVQERARIARELHDVVSHDVSFIVVQAAVERRLREGASASDSGGQDVLASIEAAGRDALTELRRMLGVLRHSDEDGAAPGHPDSAPLEPQPSLARIDDLVDQARAAGLTVALTREPAALPVLPSGVELAAYRIVQESLTNIVKHVGPTTVSVALRAHSDELDIEIVDAGPAHPSTLPGGHGLLGMRERVALFGGTLTTGPHGAGYRVLAQLPLGSS